MLTAAIIQLCAENDLAASQRLHRLKERHGELRTLLSHKLGMVETVGDLIQRVESSAEAVNSWDRTVSYAIVYLYLCTLSLVTAHYVNNNTNSRVVSVISQQIICCRVC